jgi:signal transduction histidine kinase/DNA-binding CsgD family transcriptional regulator
MDLLVDTIALERMKDGPLREGALLERVALALSSTLELREVLRSLAEVTLEATGAGRVSLFLWSGDRLEPAVALGSRRDDRLWEAFREMPPVLLTAEQFAALAPGRALAIPDAVSSPFVPDGWVDRFGLKSLLIVPLRAGGEPCGLMAVDYPETRDFDDGQVRLVEAIGAYAGVAVHSARLFEAERERGRLQEALARGALGLVRPMPPHAIAGRLGAAFTDLLGARSVGIGMVDPRGEILVPLLMTGRTEPPAPLAMSDVPDRICSRLKAAWGRAGTQASEFGDDPWLQALAGDPPGTDYTIFPLLAEGTVAGAVLVGCDPRHRAGPLARQAAALLAATGGGALERERLLEARDQKVRQLDVLYRLSGAVTEQADADVLVSCLNELLSSGDIEVLGVALGDHKLRRHLKGEALSEEDRSLLETDAEGCVPLADDIVLVPMRLQGRLVGLLRVRCRELDPDQVAFLEAVAQGAAEVTHRGALRAALGRATRDRAVAAERERIAAELQGTVGSLLEALHTRGEWLVDRVPSGTPWREKLEELSHLADGGKWELEQAVRAIDHLPAAHRGLAGAIRSLARSMAHDSGIDILVDIAGQTTRLGPAVERAIYRVAYEALTNAWRHARCTAIRVALDFSPDEIVLIVADDGIGLPARHRGRVIGLGMMSMRRAIAEVDGHFEVRSIEPHGSEVEARVGRGAGPSTDEPPPQDSSGRLRKPSPIAGVSGISGINDLTGKEQEVLSHLVERRTNSEIAERMFVSQNTVKSHVSSILRKLGSPNRRAAARRAVEERLVPFEPAGDASGTAPVTLAPASGK